MRWVETTLVVALIATLVYLLATTLRRRPEGAGAMPPEPSPDQLYLVSLQDADGSTISSESFATEWEARRAADRESRHLFFGNSVWLTHPGGFSERLHGEDGGTA
jgi:hypothetical protein